MKFMKKIKIFNYSTIFLLLILTVYAFCENIEVVKNIGSFWIDLSFITFIGVFILQLNLRHKKNKCLYSLLITLLLLGYLLIIIGNNKFIYYLYIFTISISGITNIVYIIILNLSKVKQIKEDTYK